MSFKTNVNAVRVQGHDDLEYYFSKEEYDKIVENNRIFIDFNNQIGILKGYCFIEGDGKNFGKRNQKYVNHNGRLQSETIITGNRLCEIVYPYQKEYYALYRGEWVRHNDYGAARIGEQMVCHFSKSSVNIYEEYYIYGKQLTKDEFLKRQPMFKF